MASTEDVTVIKTITKPANQKPWFTAEVHKLLKTWDTAFRAGDDIALRATRSNLSSGIKLAKCDLARNENEHHLIERHTVHVARHLDHYRTPPHACDTDVSLPDALNTFYARFEV